MGSGLYRHRVYIYEVIQAQDEYGEAVNTPFEKGMLKVKANSNDLGDVFASGIETAQNEITFDGHYSKMVGDIKPSDYLVFEDEEYNIVKINFLDYRRRKFRMVALKRR